MPKEYSHRCRDLFIINYYMPDRKLTEKYLDGDCERMTDI